MSEFIRHEPSAREIAASILARSGHRIPSSLLPEVTELLTDAAHDGFEWGASYDRAMQGAHPPGIAEYTRGYLDAIIDIDKGQESRGQ